MEAIRLIVVDDHKIIRDGIKSMLLGHTEIRIIGEAAHGYELFELLKSTQPDIVVLDINLPRISGIEIGRILKRDFPDIKVLVLTASTDEITLLSCIKAGVSGFLPKDTSKEEFLEAVDKVYHGYTYFGSNISGTLYNTLRDNMDLLQHAREEKLTDREVEIIKLFSEGLTYKEIAEKLFISARTVEGHKNKILEKLGLKTTVDLVKYAIKEGLTGL